MTTSNKGFRKLARIENRASKTFLERIGFPLHSKGYGYIELPPSAVSERKLLERNLRDAGAVLPTDPNALRSLLGEIASAPFEQEIVYAAQPGWLPNRKGFVTADRVLGKRNTKIVGFRRSKPSDPRGQIKLSGDLTGWKRTVGKVGETSSVVMFAISAALAAPLLRVTRMPSFGFCLFGPTRTGKTFATAAAGSVLGLAETKNMLDWNQTDPRLQQLLPEFNDLLTPVDDLKSMRGGDNSKKRRIASFAYILTAGAGVGRHTAFEDNTAVNWRTILLTSNETSIQQLFNAVQSERDGGATVRLIDVPAVFDGRSNICDRAASVDFRKEFPRLSLNQGHALQAFLSAVMSDEKGFKPKIRAYTEAFASHVRAEGDGALARDVADKFGLVYAAGRLGIRNDILPWKTSDLRDAIAKCYFGARDLLPDEGVLTRSGIKLLKQHLTALPDHTESHNTAIGFKEIAGTKYRVLVARDRFNGIFRSPEQRELVLSWLVSKGRITLAKGKSGPQLVKEQHFWPDGERRRSVEIFWPKSKLSPSE